MKAVFSLVCLVVVLQGSYAIQGADTTKWTPFQCRDGILGPNDDRMKEIGACKADSCAFFCHGKALGVLNSQGLPTSDIYDAWVQSTFPERHHQLAKSWFRDCMTKYGNKIDLNDKTCANAKKFGDCTWGVQPHLSCPKGPKA